VSVEQIITVLSHIKAKAEVKQSHCRPDQALRVPEG